MLLDLQLLVTEQCIVTGSVGMAVPCAEFVSAEIQLRQHRMGDPQALIYWLLKTM